MGPLLKVKDTATSWNVESCFLRWSGWELVPRDAHAVPVWRRTQQHFPLAYQNGRVGIGNLCLLLFKAIWWQRKVRRNTGTLSKCPVWKHRFQRLQQRICDCDSSLQQALGIDEQPPNGNARSAYLRIQQQSKGTPKRGTGQESVVMGPPVDTNDSDDSRDLRSSPGRGGRTALVVLLQQSDLGAINRAEPNQRRTSAHLVT